MMTNWEPLSVPATFDVVGSEVPKQRRTIAFAVQSIQKRLPKVIGPILGGFVMAAVGYWLNLTIAFGLVGLSVSLQLILTRRMKPKAEGEAVPLRKILAEMPRTLRLLLSAEIFIRWGDWFAREFAVLYVATILTQRWAWTTPAAEKATGLLLGITSFTALATYIPMAKWIDRSTSPKPFIGTTFFLFSAFPILLVLVPRLCGQFGIPGDCGTRGRLHHQRPAGIGRAGKQGAHRDGLPVEPSRACGRTLLGAALVRVLPGAVRRVAPLAAHRPGCDIPDRRRNRIGGNGLVSGQQPTRGQGDMKDVKRTKDVKSRSSEG